MEASLSPPPPLLDLLERHPDLFALEVLARLPPADRAALAGACLVSRDAVFPRSIFPAGLSRAETPGAARVFKILEFCGSAERLAWAKDNGCPWVARTFAFVAMRGQLEVLKLALAQNCPWDELTCAYAALGGRLETLKWLRERGCPWDQRPCEYAAMFGHLDSAVGAGTRLPVDREDVYSGRWEWSAGNIAVAAGAQLPVG